MKYLFILLHSGTAV